MRDQSWHGDFDHVVDLAVGRLKRLQAWAEEQQVETRYEAAAQMSHISKALKDLARKIDDVVERCPVKDEE